MTRRHTLSALLSLVMVAGAGFNAWIQFSPRGIPLKAEREDARTYVIRPIPGVALPRGIEDGDRFRLHKQDFQTRMDIQAEKLPIGHVINAVIDRGPRTLRVPLTVVDYRNFKFPGQPDYAWLAWPVVCGGVLLCAIALLVLWRGRDRAAFGMGLWATTFLLSLFAGQIPTAGWPALLLKASAAISFLTARVGFYYMADARVGAALGPTRRSRFRAAFLFLLALGAIQALGGPILFAAAGRSDLNTPEAGLMLSVSYLVPVAMLFAGYRRAAVAERQRLRWMLVSGVAWVAGIFLQNSQVLGNIASGLLSYLLFTMALLGFLYAALKHRVVDVSVVIDRALVYGLVTTLVVGVIAAVNSFALREAVTPGASLVLRVIVPLALGIVLGRVREYTDRVVERMFFRNKYLADKALRTFARRAEHIEDAPNLLNAAVREIHRHLGSPAVAIYSAEGSRYVRQAGDAAFPELLPADDPAPVALRAEQSGVDLADLASVLGEDGCAFPMMRLGKLSGILLCANRPGEHYAADEKELLTHVAREVGATWRILRARDNEAYVRAMAAGQLSLEAAREQARALTVSAPGQLSRV